MDKTREKVNAQDVTPKPKLFFETLIPILLFGCIPVTVRTIAANPYTIGIFRLGVATLFVAIFAGWIDISSNSERTSINVDRTEIEKDMDEAAVEGKEAVHELGGAVERAGEKMQHE